MRILTLFLLNAFLSVITTSAVGPAASKLEGAFGLVGAPTRAPFYLLQLYIGVAVLCMKSWLAPPLQGAIIGVVLTVPLALWSVGTKCPPFVPVAYLISGFMQGLVLGWLATPTGPARSSTLRSGESSSA